MLSSAVGTFTDPDDYAGSLQGTSAQLAIIERGSFAAKLIRVKLHRQWMQRFSESLPRIGHYANDAGRAVITFRTRPGPSVITAGLEMSMSNILLHGSAQEYFRRSSGSFELASMSISVEVLASASASIAGRDLKLPDGTVSIVPTAAAKAKLLDLHAAAGTLAEHAPTVIADAAAAHGLEQAMIEATVACLAGDDGYEEDTAAQRQHAAIMRKFYGVIERHLDEPLYIPELCAEIGVSERTLRVCCQEYLRISPKRYLLLRRMHLARRALRRSEPAGATVTEVATRYGFWQFGRFAGEYKALFGESPSAMLARAAE
jgi:AraC-like DNA-binding protein